ARLAPPRRTGGRGVLPGRDGDGDGARATQGRGPAAEAPARRRGAAVLNVLTVPNLLTLLRIVAIPIFLILLEDLRYREALGFFLLFMVTRETMEVQPSVGGKLSTFLQLASVAIVLFSHTRPGLVAPAIRELVFLLTGAVTASAGLQYMYRGLAWLQRQGEPA